MKEWGGRRGGSIGLRLEPDKRSQLVGKIAVVSKDVPGEAGHGSLCFPQLLTRTSRH